jgi:glycosyltransferase involved in cell wall biosynthesis
VNPSKPTREAELRAKTLPFFEQIDLFSVFAFLFASIFFGLTILTGISLTKGGSILGIAFLIGFEMLFIGVAYDLAEGVLALVLAPDRLPKQTPLRQCPPVALLITVCDDVIPGVLKRIQSQTYPDYDVFVLDDSSGESQRALVDRFGYTVLRRRTRRAFKAGNLNNWLDKYGARYKYYVVLDSDSVIPNDFITRMVEHAEHPQNGRIAVFQSKILPWNTSTFPRVLGAVKPLRLYILERVANRTGLFLAYGQNYLCRTDCVLQVGGYHENVTAEDTTLGLLLSAKGYSVKLVDILSYNTEPQNVFYFTRQTVRWAAQTVELFRLPWQSAAFRLKLRVCYDLYRYVVPNIPFALILIAAWSVRVDSLPLRDWITSVTTSQLRLTPWLVVSLMMVSVWAMQVAVHLILARRSGVSLRSYLAYGLLINALMFFVVAPVDVAMLRTALGARVQFNATNTRIPTVPTLRAILIHMKPSLVYGGLVLAGIAFRSRHSFVHLHLWWLLFLLAAPFLLRLFHSGNLSLEEEGNEL